MHIRATDGKIGSFDRVIFDEETLAVGYLVVRTGGWLNKHAVLIPTDAVQRVSSNRETIYLQLNKLQVRHCEPFKTFPTLTRQHELETSDVHRRSSHELIGYSLKAIDATFGKIEDLMVDDQAWIVRYLVADTRSYWPSAHVLIPTDLLGEIDWTLQTAQIQRPEEFIRSGPVFDPGQPLTPELEQNLLDHYGVARQVLKTG